MAKEYNGNIHNLLDCIHEIMATSDVRVKDLRLELGRYLHPTQIPTEHTIRLWLSPKRKRRESGCTLQIVWVHKCASEYTVNSSATSRAISMAKKETEP